jgi:hypothetical protein
VVEKSKSNMRYAKDYKCCVCGKQAEVFWPCVDPDIESSPYCKKCSRDQHIKLMVAMSDNYLV